MLTARCFRSPALGRRSSFGRRVKTGKHAINSDPFDRPMGNFSPVVLFPSTKEHGDRGGKPKTRACHQALDGLGPQDCVRHCVARYSGPHLEGNPCPFVTGERALPRVQASPNLRLQRRCLSEGLLARIETRFARLVCRKQARPIFPGCEDAVRRSARNEMR